ncbi:hypothetical protein B0T11DRAFT_270041 [Plectosphaerella cucumerina]|uniref:Uncharacterized protein n=1 Tax=Plectosphaerella cucumerina TaxID=40658 RepID=A0A8K0TSY5_9PEZI|nr:hypothetical protein B0T11DRAFT_270041 [Plectosphaerella cucumerina]
MTLTWTLTPFLSKLPLLLHVAVESAAATSFICKPSSQIKDPSLEVQLVLQSLGGSLLSTNLVSLVFIFRPEFDTTSRLVAASLASWHLWPMRRAWVRLSIAAAGNGVKEKKQTRGSQDPVVFGGPSVHLAIHAALFISLLGSAIIGSS